MNCELRSFLQVHCQVLIASAVLCFCCCGIIYYYIILHSFLFLLFQSVLHSVRVCVPRLAQRLKYRKGFIVSQLLVSSIRYWVFQHVGSMVALIDSLVVMAPVFQNVSRVLSGPFIALQCMPLFVMLWWAALWHYFPPHNGLVLHFKLTQCLTVCNEISSKQGCFHPSARISVA